MRYGIVCNWVLGTDPTGSDVIALARRAEALGFSSFVASDHVVMPTCFDASRYPAGAGGFRAGAPWYDPFVLLAGVAASTKRIAIGTGVAVVPYRPPVQQAQAIATLDFISGGRFWYGAGLGWMQEEFEALGTPFKERAPRTREYIHLMKLLWSADESPYHGQFVDFPGGRVHPVPVQKPHPPIIIGGEGLPAFKRIVEYGNGFQFNFKSAEQFALILEELGPMMEAAGRRVGELIMQLGGTTDVVRQHRQEIAALQRLGVQEIVMTSKCGSVAEGFAELEQLAREFL